MKKLMIAVLILMLLLTGCQQKQAAAPQETEPAVETPTEAAEPTEEETAAAEPAEEETAAPEPAEEETTASGEEVQIANPWREVTREEAVAECPNSFEAPEGAENPSWSVMDGGEENGKLVQLTFEQDGLTFTAREQVTGEEQDLSGLYYDWTAEDEMTLSTWRDGLMQGRTYRYIGEDGYVDLCTWYDVEIGISYSLSVSAPDLDGFDLQAVAEAIHPLAESN